MGQVVQVILYVILIVLIIAALWWLFAPYKADFDIMTSSDLLVLVNGVKVYSGVSQDTLASQMHKFDVKLSFNDVVEVKAVEKPGKSNRIIGTIKWKTHTFSISPDRLKDENVPEGRYIAYGKPRTAPLFVLPRWSAITAYFKGLTMSREMR